MLDATFGAVCESTRCSRKRRRTLEEVVNLAVELAREGREGRKIGTLFVIGDVDVVTEQSRPLILDPLHGHDDELLRIERPEFRETVKELRSSWTAPSLLRDDGTFVSAGRFIDVDVTAPENFLPGLGTRHAAAASISRTTRRSPSSSRRARSCGSSPAARFARRSSPSSSSCPEGASSRARPRCGRCPRPASPSPLRPRGSPDLRPRLR